MSLKRCLLFARASKLENLGDAIFHVCLEANTLFVKKKIYTEIETLLRQRNLLFKETTFNNYTKINVVLEWIEALPEEKRELYTIDI